MRSHRWGAVLAACAAIPVLSACGGDASSDPAGGAGPTGFQANARQSDCRDWNRAGTEDRFSIIGGIKADFGAPVEEGTPVTLSDEEAYELFDRACKPDYARGFKLYKIYIRGAAFQRYGDALRGTE